MLVIRLQRRGRKGLAQYRVIVQEKQLSPMSGKVVANLGSYDPHTKVANIDAEKASLFMSNGAQPTNRVAIIFRAEKIDLPKWVVIDEKKNKKPKKEVEEKPESKAEGSEEGEEATEEATEEVAEKVEEEKVEEPKETPKEEAETKEKESEAPKEETKELKKEEAEAIEEESKEK